MRRLLILMMLVGIPAIRIQTSEDGKRSDVIQWNVKSNQSAFQVPASDAQEVPSAFVDALFEIWKMNDSSAKEVINRLTTPETEQSDSCTCLNWKHLLKEGSASCADFPAYCKVMLTKDDNECIGWCFVSKTCDNQISTTHSGQERDIKARFCPIPPWLSFTVSESQSLQNPMSTKMLGEQFTRVNSDMDVFAMPFSIDQSTNLRRYTEVREVYAYNKAQKTFLTIWERMVAKASDFSSLNPQIMHHGTSPSQPLTVLIVSIGDGLEFEQIKSIFPENTKYFGCDVSAQMLAAGMQSLSNSGISDINLCICDGQMLPYKDSAFDRVFHVGSINAWPSIRKGLAEFHRVLKPGGLVSVADESISDTADPKEASAFRRMFWSQSYFNAPVEFLPKNATEVKVGRMNDFYYILSFSK